MSSYGSIASPPRRTYRTPRKSLRSSITQSFRRVSDKEKKNVQWRDEAGQGDLDDGGLRVDPPVICVTAVEGGVSTPSAETRAVSVGSESEWEDEKTDDSLSMSFMSSSSLHDMPSKRSGGTKRPRAGGKAGS